MEVVEKQFTKQELDLVLGNAFNLTGDSRDKSVKTHAGNRLVPLHPKLLEFGFLNYVEQIRNDNHQKLFPNLKKRRSTEYGTMIS